MPMNINIFPEAITTPTLVLIYGTSGSGKTRFLRNMAGLLRKCRGFQVLHCCTHELVENLMENLKRGAFEGFLSSLKQYKFFLIDNIWILEKKPHTAEAIFRTFKTLIHRGCFVLIASDLKPATISAWSEDISEIIRESRTYTMQGGRLGKAWQ